MSYIVEFAAWLFLSKTIFNGFAAKERRLELRAARAEYEDSRRLEYEADETRPKWMQEQSRERYQERQRQLLMRYPEALVAAPDFRYYHQVRKEAESEKTPLWETLKEQWKWWLLAICVALVGYALETVAKDLWTSM